MSFKNNLLISLLLFLSLNVLGQDDAVRTIYLMRAKKFDGSGAKMEILVNGKVVYKLKSGHRLIYKASKSDTLKFQIVYPLMRKYKSRELFIYPDNPSEVYLDAAYSSGLSNETILGATITFNIDIEKVDAVKGKQLFFEKDFYKNDEKSIVTISAESLHVAQ